jgi:DNA-binding MarR family transcriptional regulator
VRSPENYDLQILSHIDENPETTQADLATQLGVAVGSVNWYVKRLTNKGYIKVTRMQRRRLKYLLTPKGVSEKARLTREFLKASLRWYRLTREDSTRFIQEAREKGYETVCIQGDGDLAEIIYLTCLEQNMEISAGVDSELPVFHIENLQVAVAWPAEDEADSVPDAGK